MIVQGQGVEISDNWLNDVPTSLALDRHNWPMPSKSGYNLRELEGLRAPNGDFSLYDVRFREYHPKFSWTFCLIDRYTLTREGEERLVGSYVSQSCHDNAQVDLTRVGTSN